VSA
jgi:phosphosulfolactate synthase (CoM biosynthesis protein A)